MEGFRLLNEWEMATAANHDMRRLLHSVMKGFRCSNIKRMVLISDDNKSRDFNLSQTFRGSRFCSFGQIRRESAEVIRVPDDRKHFISSCFFFRRRKEILPIAIRNERFNSLLVSFETYIYKVLYSLPHHAYRIRTTINRRRDDNKAADEMRVCKRKVYCRACAPRLCDCLP